MNTVCFSRAVAGPRGARARGAEEEARALRVGHGDEGGDALNAEGRRPQSRPATNDASIQS